ncbi:uncharacterized protein LOC122309172 [Carya illinoinensis]|uniref:Plant basic secretory protein (BSP) family protein n=1 Tax=Carya illinoinensis TaxID=32201 RepID=A0A8T1QDP9_CARIL|nr:uncharacterized protein LOC122309172 [Carya illinoinensis]KAG6652527.1 hypothetical protein CIPAW_05G012700 [Carya illinoinensis]
MAAQLSLISLSSLLLLAAALHSTQAVEYIVSNRAETTSGGVTFNNQLGVEYTRQTMESASNFIWNILQQSNEADRKSVQRVSLFVDDKEPETIAYTFPSNGNYEIHVGDDYIQRIGGDMIKTDFNGVLYHEMVHVWQWLDLSTYRSGNVSEGIADFVRLKANYVPTGWVQPGGGDHWDQGYSVTARFLDYCNDLRNGFVAELNKMMKAGYNDRYFVDLLGKSADELWSEYKAKYAGN